MIQHITIPSILLDKVTHLSVNSQKIIRNCKNSGDRLSHFWRIICALREFEQNIQKRTETYENWDA